MAANSYEYKEPETTTWSGIVNQHVELYFTIFYPTLAFHINWGWGGTNDGWYCNPDGDDYVTKRWTFNITK